MPIDHVTGGLFYAAVLCFALSVMTYGAGTYICRAARDSLFGGQVPGSLTAKMRELIRQHSETGVLALVLLGLGWLFFVAAIAFTLVGIWFLALGNELLSPFQMKVLSFGLVAAAVLIGSIKLVSALIAKYRRPRKPTASEVDE